MIVAGAQTLGNADASQAAPWPLLNAGSAASSVHFWPTAIRHIPATHIANAAYPVMSVSATNRPVCIQNNNGPLRRLGERPYRSEENTSELQSLMRISYAVFCLNKNT